MKGIKWKINRLRAMGGAEILHRLGRSVRQQIEKGLIFLGWKPRPRHTVSHRGSLFAAVDGWRDQWNEHYRLDRDTLERLVRNEVDLFSYRALSVGNPVDWHRNPLTGHKVPLTFGKTLDYRDERKVGDVKVLWELGRHQHLVPIAVAYAISADRRYLESVICQIDGWIDANPFGNGIHWCSSLEVSLRLIAWSVVHSLLILSGHSDGLFSVMDDKQKLGDAIYAQAFFVRHHLSRYSSANNHLIGELCGLWER